MRDNNRYVNQHHYDKKLIEQLEANSRYSPSDRKLLDENTRLKQETEQLQNKIENYKDRMHMSVTAKDEKECHRLNRDLQSRVQELERLLKHYMDRMTLLDQEAGILASDLQLTQIDFLTSNNVTET